MIPVVEALSVIVKLQSSRMFVSSSNADTYSHRQETGFYLSIILILELSANGKLNRSNGISQHCTTVDKKSLMNETLDCFCDLTSLNLIGSTIE